jgi:hypothetical protein
MSGNLIEILIVAQKKHKNNYADKLNKDKSIDKNKKAWYSTFINQVKGNER